jgi:hypothetical protein
MILEDAIALTKATWDSHGQCDSCGWHAALYEYGDLESEITIDEEGQFIRLRCLSKDSEDRWMHRGVRIPFNAGEK